MANDMCVSDREQEYLRNNIIKRVSLGFEWLISGNEGATSLNDPRMGYSNLNKILARTHCNVTHC